MSLHSVLKRQLARLQIEEATPPSPECWRELLQRISRTYSDGDQDRYTLERSIEVSGTEMRELYADVSNKHETLLASRERTRAIFEHSVVGQALIDDAGRCIEVNAALCKLLQFESDQLIGRALVEFVTEADRERFGTVLQQLMSGVVHDLGAEQQWQSRDGEARWVNVTLSLMKPTGSQPRFTAVFVQDVHEQKRLEIELRHAQKLESVGRLAAGIAHEINTPVQFVGDNLPFLAEATAAVTQLRIRYSELLERAITAGVVQRPEIEAAERDTDIHYYDEEFPRALAQTRDGVDRVRTLVRSLMEFAHPGSGEAAQADLNHALESTITVARGELKHVADVRTELGEIPKILCFIGDLNQAFLNILVNAAHAIGDVVAKTGGRGTILVRTELQGDFVAVSISDTGGGIPKAFRSRIFEPFFTTKGVGRGTGQGLALARLVVVDRHYGQLSFETREGEGTTFRILLPVHPPAEPLPIVASSRAPARQESSRSDADAIGK
ncbi:MAG TPA: ATP-binding protein [Polyangiales bacterium]|nr:ATP-binding protein [Polyangiales bacterium]